MKYTIIKSGLLIFSAFLIVVLPFFSLWQDDTVLPVGPANILSENKNPLPILLDAGHGGEDGGAVGVDGILEKDINLPVTLKTGTFLRFFGYPTDFTRKTDEMTCDDGLKTQRSKKVSDIKNRFSMLENGNYSCFLSIHQNFFGGNAHGAQIFYGPKNGESAALAEALQSHLILLLQKDNKRVIKPVTDDVYIVYRTNKPAVLAECGFISNREDAEMLKNESYQNKLAFVLTAGTIQYLTEREVI